MKSNIKYILSIIAIFVLLLVGIIGFNYYELNKEVGVIHSVLEDKKSDYDGIFYETKKGMYSKGEKERLIKDKSYKNTGIYLLEYSNKMVLNYKNISLIEVGEDESWDLALLALKIVTDLIMVVLATTVIPIVVTLFNNIRNHFINGGVELGLRKIIDIAMVSSVGGYVLVKIVDVFLLNLNLVIVYVILVGLVYVLLILNEESVLNKKSIADDRKEKEEIKRRREDRLKKNKEKEKAKEKAKAKEKEKNKEKEKEKNKEKEKVGIEKEENKIVGEFKNKDIKDNDIKDNDVNNSIAEDVIDDKSEDVIIDLGEGYRDFLNDSNKISEENDLEAIRSHFERIEIEMDIEDFLQKVKEGKIKLVDGEYKEED